MLANCFICGLEMHKSALTIISLDGTPMICCHYCKGNYPGICFSRSNAFLFGRLKSQRKVEAFRLYVKRAKQLMEMKPGFFSDRRAYLKELVGKSPKEALIIFSKTIPELADMIKQGLYDMDFLDVKVKDNKIPDKLYEALVKRTIELIPASTYARTRTQIQMLEQMEPPTRTETINPFLGEWVIRQADEAVNP